VGTVWELLRTEPIGMAGRRRIVAKTFRLPDGSETVFQVTGDESHRAAACVALTDRGTAVLAEQYRPGPERLMMELPGGGVEPGESLEEAAARELAEETGYVPARLTFLGDMCYDAYCGGTRNYFLAAGCERRQEQSLDPGEFVNVREVSLGDLVTFALTGRMTDPGGVMLALPYLTGDPEVRAALAPRHLPGSAQAGQHLV
jgi:ADP-ribose pyrophosphatase